MDERVFLRLDIHVSLMTNARPSVAMYLVMSCILCLWPDVLVSLMTHVWPSVALYLVMSCALRLWL